MISKDVIFKSSKHILKKEQEALANLIDGQEEEEIVFYKGSIQCLTDELNSLLDQIGEMASKICNKDRVLTMDDLKLAINLVTQMVEK